MPHNCPVEQKKLYKHQADRRAGKLNLNKPHKIGLEILTCLLCLIVPVILFYLIATTIY